MSAQPATRRRRPYAPRVPIEQRREDLMDAAMRVIARDGYQKVTVEAVAREAGVTKPVLYGAYDDLPALLGALLDRQQGRALLQLLAALPLDAAAMRPAALVDRIVRAWVDLVTNDPVTWGPILLAQQGTPEVVWHRIELAKETLRARLAELIATQVGGLDPAPDADLLAHAVLAMAEHFGRLLLLDAGQVDVDRLVTTMQIVLAGFSRSEG